VIQVNALTKYYGEKAAIDGVTFQVQKGEVLGLLGPNGAGKTTTMRILTCYMPPTSGDATIAGFNIWDEPMEIKRRLGYLPENPPLYTDLRVSEYLEFVAKIKEVPKDRIPSAISSAVEKAGLTDVVNKVIGHLSKGYKQRVGLAQALLNDPDVLILDEPTVGLDPRQIIEIRELIKALGGEHTVILSTHILPEVEMTCGRVVIINEGKVVAQDTPDGLTQRLKGTERIILEVKADGQQMEPIFSRFPQITRFQLEDSKNGVQKYVVETTEDIRNELAKAVVQNNIDLFELHSESLSLEEIFLHLTTKEEVA